MCSPKPVSRCLGIWRTNFLRVHEETPGREQLIVRLRRGPALQADDLGDPRAPGGSAYQICLYDAADVLVGEIEIDAAGESCGAKPCWRALGAPSSGYVYRHQGLVLKLRNAPSLRSYISLTATNDGHGVEPMPPGIAARLSGSPLVTIKVLSSDAACFSASTSDLEIDLPATLETSDR